MAPPEFPATPPEIKVTPLFAAPPPGAERIRFVLRNVVVEGATAYSPEELHALYAGSIGKEISLTRVFDIAERVQERYRTDGYLLTRVIVPEQTVRDGVVRLQVIEGFIDGVRVEGDIGPVRARVQAYLERLKGRRPLRQEELERYLLLATDIPGVQAYGVLQRGHSEPGAAELVVKATRKPFEGLALVNNRGSKYTGPVRGAISLQENAATRLGEHVGVYALAAQEWEQGYVQLSYGQPLGDEGVQLLVYGAYGSSEPGFTLEPLNVDTEILVGNLSVSYPLIRSRQRNLFLEGGFQAISSRVDVLGQRFTRDELRILFARATYQSPGPLDGYLQAGAGIRQGLSWLGASDSDSPDVSRPGGESDGTALTATGSYLLPLGSRLALNLDASGQYGFRKLLSDEEFRLGGEACGRGYDPSELAGDSGLCLSSELRYRRPTDFGPIRGYEAYGFHDVGAVWLKDGSDSRASLASAGVGVRTQFVSDVYLDLEVAWPLTRAPVTRGDKDPEVYIGLVGRF